MYIEQKLEGKEIKDIDVNKIVIPFNYVLIKLDPDHDVYHNTETGESTGIHVAPFGHNQASHINTTGTVVVVPQNLIFNGYKTAVLKRDKMRTESEQQHIADLRLASMAYDVPMEVKPGMRVYFEYLTRIDAFKQGRVIENEQGKFVFIPYDLLIMAFRPGTNFDDVQIRDVYMLNGFVLIKPLEYQTETNSDGIKGVLTENDLFMPVQPDAKFVKRGDLWYGVVLAAGCGVRAYADFPGRGGEYEAKNTPGCQPGNKIIFTGKMKKRLEVKQHRIIFKKFELYRIHRKDILGWFPTGDINGMPKV